MYVCVISCTSLANGSLQISNAVDRWYVRISRNATVPGLRERRTDVDRHVATTGRRAITQASQPGLPGTHLWRYFLRAGTDASDADDADSPARLRGCADPPLRGAIAREHARAVRFSGAARRGARARRPHKNQFRIENILHRNRGADAEFHQNRIDINIFEQHSSDLERGIRPFHFFANEGAILILILFHFLTPQPPPAPPPS